MAVEQTTRVYHGFFNSTYYAHFFCRGTFEISGPLDFSKLATADNLSIKMEYTGVYKYGQTMEFSAKCNEGKWHGSLPSYPGFVNQTFTMTIETITEAEIAGTYVSNNPEDRGTFRILAGPKLSPSRRCIVM